MKNIFKSKVAAIVFATTILSLNNVKAWTFSDYFKSDNDNSQSFILKYTKPIGKDILELGKEYFNKTKGFSTIAESYLHKIYNYPLELLKPSTGVIPNYNNKISQLFKIAKDANPGFINIQKEDKCLKIFSNSINNIANSLESEKKQSVLSHIFSKSNPNTIMKIYDKVAKNGITNSIEANRINEITSLEKKAYDAFSQCVKNIPIEKLSFISKGIKSMQIDINSDLIKIKFETIKFLFKSFLDTVAPKNETIQSTIIWLIIIVGIPATTYGIYKLVRLIIKIIPTISKLCFIVIKKISIGTFKSGKYTVNKSYELGKYITIKILYLLKITSKALLIKAPMKMINGIASFLCKNPLVTTSMSTGILGTILIYNKINSL